VTRGPEVDGPSQVIDVTLVIWIQRNLLVYKKGRASRSEGRSWVSKILKGSQGTEIEYSPKALKEIAVNMLIRC